MIDQEAAANTKNSLSQEKRNKEGQDKQEKLPHTDKKIDKEEERIIKSIHDETLTEDEKFEGIITHFSENQPSPTSQELAALSKPTEEESSLAIKQELVQNTPLGSSAEKDSRQAVRQFTKSTQEGKDIRRETAAQILEERKKRSENNQAIKKVATRVDELTRDIGQDRAILTQTKQEIDRLKLDLDERKASLMMQVFDWVRPGKKRELYKKLHGDFNSQHDLQQKNFESTEQLEDSRREFAELYEEKTKLKDARETLIKFYHEQGAKLEELKRQEYLDEIRRVNHVALEKKVIFVHGITANYYGSENTNSFIKPDIPWQTKLDVVLGFQPDISTSTIQQGDNPSRMWSGMGLIISDGLIEEAYPTDVGTEAKGIKERGRDQIDEQLSLEEQINNAILNRNIGEYAQHNEFVIDSPEIAGFYINIDDNYNWGEKMPPREEIIRKVAETGLSLYVIKQGLVYEADYRFDQRGMAMVNPRGDPILPEEIAKRKHQLTEGQKKSLRERSLTYMNLPTAA